MSDFQFTEDAIPAIGNGRKAAPNPLAAFVAKANEKRDASLKTTLKASTPAELDAELVKVRRNLTRAGNDLGVTVRFKAEKDVKATSAEIKFWVVDKITKPRNGEAK